MDSTSSLKTSIVWVEMVKKQIAAHSFPTAMANGPPTPPPTTAAEILDEQRSDSPRIVEQVVAAPPAVPITITGQDGYQLLLATLVDLAAQGNLDSLIHTVEAHDLRGDHDRNPTRLLIIAPLVLAYLITDDLAPAWHALTRLPDNIAALPLCQALSGLLASTWERKYANVYARASSLLTLVGQPEFSDGRFGAMLASLVVNFVDSFRQRAFATISKAYTSLPLSLAATYLGLPEDQLLIEVAKGQWSYDPSTQILSPPTPTSTYIRLGGEITGPSSLVTFHLVADGVVKLEN